MPRPEIVVHLASASNSATTPSARYSTADALSRVSAYGWLGALLFAPLGFAHKRRLYSAISLRSSSLRRRFARKKCEIPPAATRPCTQASTGRTHVGISPSSAIPGPSTRIKVMIKAVTGTARRVARNHMTTMSQIGRNCFGCSPNSLNIRAFGSDAHDCASAPPWLRHQQRTIRR